MRINKKDATIIFVSIIVVVGMCSYLIGWNLSLNNLAEEMQKENLVFCRADAAQPSYQLPSPPYVLDVDMGELK